MNSGFKPTPICVSRRRHANFAAFSERDFGSCPELLESVIAGKSRSFALRLGWSLEIANDLGFTR